ncbi:MAG: tripartite tricarboxylate transporter TctB family protein [Deltaproteobacteria bacterium]|nr:tripartite tricarboxylate transporter TctB family protein [Deltaproteobacteria bacterium]
MRIKSNQILAIGILHFCALTYFILIPTIPLGLATDMHLGLTPRFFPKFITVCMAIIAGLMLIRSLLKPGVPLEVSADAGQKILPLVNALVILVVGFLYIYMLEWVGYFFSTPLILAFYLWYFGVRKWISIGLISLITMGALYYFFGTVLHVLIPTGALF